MPDNPTAMSAATDDTVIHVIQSSYHYRDADNRPKTEEELLVDEGWFADAASATVRCDQLNAKNRSYYETSMAAQKRSHDAKVRQAEKTNKEAAAIRAAGMTKADAPVPAPFEPETFEKFFATSNHTTYEAVEVRRSDHDGIARACAAEPAIPDDPDIKSSTDLDAAKGAASRTA